MRDARVAVLRVAVGAALACAGPALAARQRERAAVTYVAPPLADVVMDEPPPQSAPVPAGVAAQALSFERVFASPALNGPVPRALRLSPDGRWLTLLRGRADDRERYDLWGMELPGGAWRMLVDSRAIGLGGATTEAEKMQRERLRIGDLTGITGYEWSADSRHLLIPGAGGLALADTGGHVRAITGAEGDVLNATLSPAGRLLSFVRARRLWVVPVDGSGPALAITPEEATGTVHWGEAEFVAQEEMHRYAGAWWAPDEQRIAVARFDEAPVDVVTRAAIGASGTTTFAQRYPLAGSANVGISLWVMGPDGSAPVQVDLGDDPDIYLARVDWAPDGRTLYVQRENRAQTRLDMLAVDPATGAAHVLFTEKARAGAWINLTDHYRFLKDGGLVWWSERDGYGHLWLWQHGDWRQLTRGPWVVTALVGVDEAAGRVFFSATKDDVLAQQIYALDMADPTRIVRLSAPGWSTAASMDRVGHRLIVTRSAPAQPPQTYLADAGGRRLMWIEQNAVGAGHPYAPFLAAHRAPTFGTIRARDGSDLYWRMIVPAGVPAGGRWPVFFSHYGGPGVQVVSRGWTGALAQAVVQAGYIWFELDGRGSANRGVGFESQIHAGMGSVEVEDQLAGVAYLKSLDFVDPARIATYGWSYGGYMTLKLLEAAPGTFAAGVAGAPVTRWELYDTHYTERYLGMPQAPGGVYAKADALGEADRIVDPLLVIHGMADDNVVFENSSELIAKLQGEARPFDMMLYPGQTHAVGGPKISVHLWTTILGFLARHGVTPGAVKN